MLVLNSTAVFAQLQDHVVGFLWATQCKSIHLVAASTFCQPATEAVHIDVYNFVEDKPAGEAVYNPTSAIFCINSKVHKGVPRLQLILRKPYSPPHWGTSEEPNPLLAGHCLLSPDSTAGNLMVFVRESLPSGELAFRDGAPEDLNRVVTALRQ
jgi:hypothetical protein